MQQPPIRNASIVAASVFSHSGEFGAVSLDVRVPGRGHNLDLIRSYRSSLAERIGALGRGWSCNLARRVERDGNNLLYGDGTGSVHRFAHRKGGQYTSPPDLYSVLHESKRELFLEQRFGTRIVFQAPEQGGQLLAVTDRNGNEIRFSYTADSVQIADTVNRKIQISVEDGLWRMVTDHAGRTWRFLYDANCLLVEVVRPATRDFPKGTSVTYGYDAHHRLVTLTDARGQTYLVNHYDKVGRVVRQTHGEGKYALEYGDNHRTSCRLKNGGMLELDHDEAGHATRSRLHVGSSAFSQEDLTDPHMAVQLVTESAYNKAGELISRRTPSGREMRWTYAEDDGDPRNRGNLLSFTQLPRPGTASGFGRITRTFEYAKEFQVVAAAVEPRGDRTSFEYDGRGNLVARTYPAVTIQPVGDERAEAAGFERVQQVRFDYDEHGRPVRRTEVDGTVTAFFYHPEGLLARVVRDADGVQLANEYRYDDFGNCTETFDGKGNATRLVFNAMGRVETCFSRAPFEYRIDYTYDENYDEIESTQLFEHLVADRATGKTDTRRSTLREQRSYDQLGNVVERRILGGDQVVREEFIRDAAARLIRQIQPAGNVTEYTYDERDLVITKRSAVGAEEGFIQRFTYTLDGSPRSHTTGDGNKTVHRYDGFERYQGFIDPSGTMKHQARDVAGNVVAVTVSDSNSILMQAHYQLDEWNRVFRIDRAWLDLETGEPSGKSEWDGKKGVVSTVIEYGERGRPAKVWNESQNITAYAYDGCARLTAVTDSTGQGLSLAYDENGNMTELTASGPGGSNRRVLRRSFDAMDRLELQQVEEDASERFRYNAFGAVVEYIGRSGLPIYHTNDELGRHTGHAYDLHRADRETKRVGAPKRDVVARRSASHSALTGPPQSVIRQFEYDDNYRLTKYVDAAANRSTYKYDELDRQTSVVYPDGSIARVEYDARGNAVRVVDANGHATTNRYDGAGRIVETIDSAGQSTRYTYDGSGRLLTASGRDTLHRTYDSLSNVTTEVQRLGTVRFEHDSAGNLIGLVYPSGREVRRTYDQRQRVTSVRNGDGTPIATFEYGDTDRVTKIQYGDALIATFEYDANNRLELVEYRAAADGRLIDGYRYAYDARDMMTHEIHVTAGEAFGERYFFDEARRPARAQYGVRDIFDPASPFERETTYEYFPEGKWSRRVDRTGQVVEESTGTVDSRNRYQSFGKYTFSYDSNGNRIRKESSNPGYCLYTYDDANRLIKVECYDIKAQLVQSIEYFYDALGRQIRKVVAGAADMSTEYTYVWIGSLLAEEYENGKLARSYIYGIGAMPVQLSSQKAGGDFTYLLNGRGLVSGIVHNDDPNSFAEKYGYDLTGNVYMTEVDGLPVGIPSRSTTISGLDNPIVTGDIFGSVMSDWANGTLCGPSGGHMDETLSDALNALGDLGTQGHQSVTSTLANQLNSIASMLGLGGNASAPSGTTSDPGFTMNPDWKLYADGEDDGSPAPTDGGSPTPTDSGSPAPTDSGQPSDAPKNTSLTPTPTNDPGGLKSGAGGGGADGGTNLMDNIKKTIDAVPLTGGSTKGGGYWGGVKVPLYTDPDASSGTTAVMPTPGELEARFNSLKYPVNPNDGTTDNPVDTSSPPPNKGGIDPTIILVDSDLAVSTGDATGTNPLDNAPIDFVPGAQAAPGAVPQPNGGDTDGDPMGWPNP
jgi:YD repeat-containing protein